MSSTTSSLSKAEKSYIQTGILSPWRADGRRLTSFRPIALDTDVAALANGSARLRMGGNGGTEVLAAVKLEVEGVSSSGSGRIACSVTCSPTAYPYLPSSSIDDLSHDYTSLLSSILTHPSLLPSNLSILPRKKAWIVHIDVLVLSDAGNVYDALFMATRAALWDTNVPRTRGVEYKAKARAGAGTGSSGGMLNSRTTSTDAAEMQVDEETQSGFDTRTSMTDFELPDYWDEGEPLAGREKFPVCVTLNLIPPTAHFLDASLAEEASTPLRLLLLFAFTASSPSTSSPTSLIPKIQGIRTLGSGELTSVQLAELIKEGQKYAQTMYLALNAKLKA